MKPTVPLLAAALTMGVALGHVATAQDLGAPAEDGSAGIGVFAPEAGDADEAPAEDAAPGAAAEEAAPAEAAPADAAEDAPAEAAEEAPAEPAEDAPAEDAPAEAGPAEELPAEAEGLVPQLPQPEVVEVVRDTFGDWEVRCAPEGDDCFLYQLTHDDEDNPVAEYSLVRLANAGEAVAGVTVVTPLGTLLPAGVVMQVDGGEARQYDFTFCSQVGCFARFGLTNDVVERMKRGRTARITLVSIGAPDQPVSLDVSLMGFTAGYDSLTPVPAE